MLLDELPVLVIRRIATTAGQHVSTAPGDSGRGISVVHHVRLRLGRLVRVSASIQRQRNAHDDYADGGDAASEAGHQEAVVRRVAARVSTCEWEDSARGSYKSYFFISLENNKL